MENFPIFISGFCIVKNAMWILLLHILFAMGLSIILPLYFIQTYYLSVSIIFSLMRCY